MATLSSPRIPAAASANGAALAMLYGAVLLAAFLFSYFGLHPAPAAGRQRQIERKSDAGGMEYLQSCRDAG